MADTLREFLVGLGFSVDDASQRKFTAAIEGATLRAKLLGDAIEEMARATVGAVSQVATQFEQLFYQSQRLGASASSIRAYEYAISQLGGTVEGANSSLEDFGSFLRNTPGAAGAISRSLGIPLKDAADHAKFLLEAQQKLGNMRPAVADRYREAYHLGDPATLFAGERPEAEGFYNAQLGRDKGAGIGQGATQAAVKFEQAWRDVWAKIGTMAEGGETKLLAALTNPMQKFGDWLDKNSGKINDAISTMATSVGALTTAWVDDLNKVNWGDVAKDFDNVTHSIAGFVSELTGMIHWLTTLNEESKGWWITKLMNSAAGAPASTQQPGATDGAGAGLRKWWGDHAPSWLGGNSGGVSQNGQPISESNPLSVSVVKLPDDAAGGGGGGGILGSIGSAISGLFGRGGGGGGGNSGPHGVMRGVGGWWTPDRISHAVDRLTKEAGLTREGAAGLVARWSAIESTGGPNVRNGIGAWGIGQWLGPRKQGIDGNPDFDAQISHAVTELNTTEKRAGDVLRNARTGREGARGASMYERAEGYNAATGTDNFTGSTPAERVLGVLDKAKAVAVAPATAHSATGALPKVKFITPHTGWDQGSVWSGLNANLPHSSPISGASRHVHSTVNNTIHVETSDPKAAASMVGVHLDRTSADVSRNLQGAHQ